MSFLNIGSRLDGLGPPTSRVAWLRASRIRDGLLQLHRVGALDSARESACAALCTCSYTHVHVCSRATRSEFTGPHAANHGVEIWPAPEETHLVQLRGSADCQVRPETVAHAKERAAALGVDVASACLGPSNCCLPGKTTIQFTTGNIYQLNVNETMRRYLRATGNRVFIRTIGLQ